MNIVLDLRAIYWHFAGTLFIQPRLASVKGRAVRDMQREPNRPEGREYISVIFGPLGQSRS